MLNINEIKTIDRLAQYAHMQIFDVEDFRYDRLDNALKKHGIDVRWVISDNNINGYLRYDNSTQCPVIAVSVNDILSSWVQRRFVMAYELGSLIVKYDWHIDDFTHNQQLNLGKSDFLDICGATKESEKEDKTKQLNEFAYSFLIPNCKLKPIIDNAIKNNISGEELVNDVAIRFDTSTATSQAKIISYLKNIHHAK